jgi:hypothetical protein
MDTEEKLVTVYRACGQPEAEIVRGRLEIEGIQALLKYESIGSVYGLTVDGLGQVEVQVPARFVSRAREIIESTDNEIED